MESNNSYLINVESEFMTRLRYKYPQKMVVAVKADSAVPHDP